MLERKTNGKSQNSYRWPFRLFIGEIREQCNMALIAIEDLNKLASIKPLDNSRFWYSIHGFLSTTANVSKLLSFSNFSYRKGSPLESYKEANKTLKKNLRRYCRVSSNSIVMQRNFRNHYEHYDERLFEWAMNDSSMMMEYHIGTPETLRSQLDLSEKISIKPLKCFDPSTSSLQCYDETLNIDKLIQEIERIKKRTETYFKK
jgi:hypothetical protein